MNSLPTGPLKNEPIPLKEKRQAFSSALASRCHIKNWERKNGASEAGGPIKIGKMKKKYGNTMGIFFLILLFAKPLAGLKRLARFWCLGGGGGARLVQTWVWPFFVHRLAGARNQENLVLENTFFGVKFQFFGEKLVLKIHFLGFRMHFLGFGNFDETSWGFPWSCQGSMEVVKSTMCVFLFPPLAPKLAKLLKPIRGYLNRLLFFRPS